MSKYWIHVTNLSPLTTGERLAELFKTEVGYVVLDITNREAWIKEYKEESLAKIIAEQLDKKQIDGHVISSQHKAEIYRPRDLCGYAMNNKCYSDNCIFIHSLCTDPENCTNEECYLQHNSDRQRRIPSAGKNFILLQICFVIKIFLSFLYSSLC
jgi:hypothetical protein